MITDVVNEAGEPLSESNTCPTIETTAPGVAGAARPRYVTIEDFVSHVIYDGRFLTTFTAAPERVAAELGVELAPEVVEGLRGRDRGQVLAETTEKMTRAYGERKKVVDPARPDIMADFGIVIGAAIGGTVVVSIVCVFVAQAPVVVDQSSEADEKL